MSTYLFCSLPPDRLWVETEHAVAVSDVTPDEQQESWKLVAEVRERLLSDLKPHGFNIGFNEGIAAGKTVEHSHVHVIPRRTGDVPDPRGWIRWVIAGNAPYWKK